MTRGDSAISVILSNYNHGRYLRRAVGALLGQDLPPREIIIIDDGSTDDSRVIIDELAHRSAAIRVLVNPRNIGLVLSQRRGLEMVTGRYIHLAAADDWVLPGFFSRAAAMLERHDGAGLFFGDAALVDGLNGTPLGIRPAAMLRFRPGFIGPAQARGMLAYSDHWLVTGAALIRRDALDAAGGLDAELGSFADGYLVRKIALTRGMVYRPGVVATWCIFPNSASRQTARKLDQARAILGVVPRKIAADPAFPVWYAARYSERWRFATARLALQENPPDIDFVLAMAGQTGFDRWVIARAAMLLKGSAARIATLAWLWWRLRPYRLTQLIATMLYRKIALRHDKAVATSYAANPILKSDAPSLG